MSWGRFLVLALVSAVMVFNTANAQIEAGDKNVGLQGSYYSILGDADFTWGLLNGVLSYYTSPFMEIGSGLGVTIYDTGSESTTSYTLSPFFNYNFVADAKTVPYVGGTLSFQDSGGKGSDMVVFYGAKGGIKYFFDEKLNWDTSLNLLLTGEEGMDGLFYLSTGLNFLMK